jgi:predicted aspartyl protease
MSRFYVDVDLTNYGDLIRLEDKILPKDQVRRERISGLVDPGASDLVIPAATAAKLGVAATGKANVRYADGRRAVRDVVEGVRVDLEGRHGLFNAIVEPKRKEALIGAIVLEVLDLMVDSRREKLVPRDPHSIIAEIE